MDTNENILKWFNGEISDETAQQLLAAEEFDFHLKLKFFTDKVMLTSINTDEHFNAVQQKMSQPKTVNSTPIRWLRYASVAAVLALSFGAFQLFFFSHKTEVAVGDSKTLLLPDHSVVVINSHSEIAYPSLFQVNKKLKLKGEAYFEVEKGSIFNVITPQGTVQVLGTKFNVATYTNWFEVRCYEGSVAVKTHNQKTILTPGTSVRSGENGLEKFKNTDNYPQWIKGESTFKSVPLAVVMQSFTNRFGKKVELPKAYSDLKFSGGFVHNDIEKALMSLCYPVGLQYKIEQDKIILTALK